MADAETKQERVVLLSSAIVTAYVRRNRVGKDELADVPRSVHATLSRLGHEPHSAPAEEHKATPAEIRRSITPEHLISFEDSKPYQTLRRHLRVRGLAPEAYRAKWGLPSDYPMTAPGYSTRRSDLARARGFGLIHRAPLDDVASNGQDQPAPQNEQMAASVDQDGADVGIHATGQGSDENEATFTHEPFEEDGAASKA